MYLKMQYFFSKMYTIHAGQVENKEICINMEKSHPWMTYTTHPPCPNYYSKKVNI